MHRSMIRCIQFKLVVNWLQVIVFLQLIFLSHLIVLYLYINENNSFIEMNILIFI